MSVEDEWTKRAHKTTKIKKNRNHKTKICAISGFAFSGKNSVAEVLKTWAGNSEIIYKHFSFAHTLKQKLDSFLLEEFGISAFTQIKEEKQLIRNILVSFGDAKRLQSSGKFWWQKVEKEIDDFFNDDGQLAIIDDLRFCSFGETDELAFIQNRDGIIVYVERERVGAPNQSEADNLPEIKENANFKISWKGGEDEAARRAYCHEVISYLEKYFG